MEFEDFEMDPEENYLVGFLLILMTLNDQDLSLVDLFYTYQASLLPQLVSLKHEA